MSDTFKFKMSLEQLSFYLNKIHDLLSIDDEILMKIGPQKTLLYCVVGERSSVNAFKSFIFNTQEIFTFIDTLEKEIRFIITNGKKFETTLKNFTDYKEEIFCEFFMNDDVYADNLKLKNTILRTSMSGGDVRGMNTTIDIEKINKTIDKDNIDFKFSLTKDTHDKIKKLSSIDTENDIFTLNIIDNVITIGEKNWDIKICDIEHEDLVISFPKKYFKSITYTEDSIEIFVFDTFLLVDNSNTNLLIALELTI